MAFPVGMNRVKTAIVGASGYTGMELLRLLLGHPAVELTAGELWRSKPAYVFVVSRPG
jgi:N-acetyl-gamma-glutamylphosphate reductase